MGEASDLSSGPLHLIQRIQCVQLTASQPASQPAATTKEDGCFCVDFSCYITSNGFRPNGEIKADGKSSIVEENGFVGEG